MQPTTLPILTSAAALTVITTGATRRFAVARGIVNHPNPIVPQHTRPVAYLGGVGIFLGCAATVGALALLHRLGLARAAALAVPGPVAVGALLFLVLGVIDDVVVLSAAAKFGCQVVAAATAVSLGLGRPITGIGVVDRLICAWWVLTLVNAFNFTDVCDGLVAGLACVTFVAVAALGWVAGGLPVMLAGACVGFLVWNRPPARIFLGDAGSHLLGFLAAALTLAAPTVPAAPRSAQIVLLVAVPLFELTFLTCVRIRKGLAWWKGSPDHFALRLQSAGLTRLQTDVVAWSLAAALAGVAIVLPALSPATAVATLVAVLLVLAGCARLLLRWEVVRPPAAVVAPPQAVALSVGS